MRTLELSKTSSQVASFARGLQDPVVLTEGGKPVASVVPLGDSDWEEISLAMSPKFIEMLQKSRESYRRHGGLTSDQVRKALGIKASKRTRRKK
jgi:antitoxin (DNA-binding transcriptional repressor) of toxin-antitoxin stability system